MHFKRELKAVPHTPTHKTSGDKHSADSLRKIKSHADGRTFRGRNRDCTKKRFNETGTTTMARFDLQNFTYATIAGENRAEAFCNMGLMYATGRGCDIDVVAAHKWLNIAAIKGSERAAELRAELAATMSKADLAIALRSAREWMTVH
ncbi:hypothetical protein C8J31_11326 [Rhizobium sp. PP-CC-2G-626]|nr:hypothetical protein C8J31_11326 [Rhizobium sp. PP-CC-2G-626]